MVGLPIPHYGLKSHYCDRRDSSPGVVKDKYVQEEKSGCRTVQARYVMSILMKDVVQRIWAVSNFTNQC